MAADDPEGFLVVGQVRLTTLYLTDRLVQFLAQARVGFKDPCDLLVERVPARIGRHTENATGGAQDLRPLATDAVCACSLPVGPERLDEGVAHVP